MLVLGAGRVSAPLVEYLHRDEAIGITIASDQKDQGDELARTYPGVESTYLNAMENSSALKELVRDADVVVSILPANMHHLVAEACIAENTNMVTASYVSPLTKKLHDKAVEAGVTILNEVGLDPGFDHLLALECIHDVKKQGEYLLLTLDLDTVQAQSFQMHFQGDE